MKRSLAIHLVIATMVGLGVSPVSPSAQSRATAENVPVIPHEAVPNFFKNPAGIYTGENMGIATNSKGNIYIYHRAYETQYLYVSHAGDEDGMEDAAIYKVRLDGTVVAKFGAAGKRPKEFGLANSIDCRNENELLVGEMTNWRVQKLTLEPAN